MIWHRFYLQFSTPHALPHSTVTANAHHVYSPQTILLATMVLIFLKKLASQWLCQNASKYIQNISFATHGLAFGRPYSTCAPRCQRQLIFGWNFHTTFLIFPLKIDRPPTTNPTQIPLSLFFERWLVPGFSKKKKITIQVRTRRKKKEQCIGATQSLYPVRVQILQQCHKDIVLLVVQGNFMLCAFSHGSLQHSFQWVTFATKERKRKKRSTLKKNSTHSSIGPNHLHRHIKIQRCA